MARYIGPKSKIARKFKEPIYGPDKYLEKKNYPPGQHGVNKKRGAGKVSEYSMQLQEKQKSKYSYGILERQFRGMFHKASAKKGITGVILLQMIEMRLDNLVYRFGIAPTRAAACQLVSHRHIVVNGKVMGIPSAIMKVGDVIGVRERSKALEMITDSLGRHNASQYPWLEWDENMMAGKVTQIPEREQIPENINEQMIVDLYSK